MLKDPVNKGTVTVGPLTPVGLPRDQAIELAASGLTHRAALFAEARNKGDTAFIHEVYARMRAEMPAKRRAALAGIAGTAALAATTPIGGPELAEGKAVLPYLLKHAGLSAFANSLPGVVSGVIGGENPSSIAAQAAHRAIIGAGVGAGAAALPVAAQAASRADLPGRAVRSLGNMLDYANEHANPGLSVMEVKSPTTGSTLLVDRRAIPRDPDSYENQMYRAKRAYTNAMDAFHDLVQPLSHAEAKPLRTSVATGETSPTAFAAGIAPNGDVAPGRAEAVAQNLADAHDTFHRLMQHPDFTRFFSPKLAVAAGVGLGGVASKPDGLFGGSQQ